MNSQLALDLVGIQLFAETEGPRIVDPIIESRIPGELRPQQAIVQRFIVSLFPDLCERLLEQVQAQREAWNRPSLSQELTSSRTTDSGFNSEDSQAPTRVPTDMDRASTASLQTSQHMPNGTSQLEERSERPPQDIGGHGNEGLNGSSYPYTSGLPHELPQLDMTIPSAAQQGLQSHEAFTLSDPALDAIHDEEAFQFSDVDWNQILQGNCEPFPGADWDLELTSFPLP